MALTRKLLKSMGIEDEKIDQIIEAHTETVNALKDERDTFKADAEKLSAVQKELNDLKKDGDKNPWKAKYEAVKEDLENLKTETAKAATAAKVKAAYTELLKAAGVAEKRIAVVLKCTDLDGIKLDGDGKIENAKELTKSIKSEWADFITESEKKGVGGENPPAGNPGSVKTREEIYKKDEHGRFILDATQRQEELGRLIAVEQQQKGQ